jgi:hypothetical protein
MVWVDVGASLQKHTCVGLNRCFREHCSVCASQGHVCLAFCFASCPVHGHHGALLLPWPAVTSYGTQPRCTFVQKDRQLTLTMATKFHTTNSAALCAGRCVLSAA